MFYFYYLHFSEYIPYFDFGIHIFLICLSILLQSLMFLKLRFQKESFIQSNNEGMPNENSLG